MWGKMLSKKNGFQQTVINLRTFDSLLKNFLTIF